MSHKLKILILLAISFGVTISIVLFLIDSNKTNIIDRALDKQLKILKTNYDLNLQYFKDHSIGAYTRIQNHKRIINILSKAQDSSKDQKDILRKELIKLLSAQYKRLQEKGAYQFNFILPNNIVFLRMHKQNKYEDDVSTFRYSIKYTNETKKSIEGFENGKRSHAFRYLYPLFHKQTKQYLGAVEISFNSKKIQDNLTNISKIHSHFIINKNGFKSESWNDKDQLYTYHQSIEHKDFLFLTDFMTHHTTLMNSEDEIIRPMKKFIDTNIALEKEFTFYVALKDKVKVVSFLPIKNIKDNSTKAYMVAYTDNAHIESVLAQVTRMQVILILTLLVLFIFIYKILMQKEYLQSQVEKKTKELANINTNLEKIVKEEIAKNKEQEELLTQQSKMASMGEMMESIAHQWRQPLSIITTSSSGIKMQKEFGMLNDEILLKSCDSITQSAEYLSQTINDFRNFFHEDKVKRYFKIEDICNKTLNLLVSKFKNKEIEIIKKSDNIEIKGFGNELVQVFMNILNNARDELETKEYKRLLFIDIYKQNDKAIIKIKDNAGGIPKDILPKIFDARFTTKQDRDGTGIGLYMSKKIIINSFSGSIEASNIEYTYEEEKYVGAEFTITL